MNCDRCGNDFPMFDLYPVPRIDNTPNCGSYHNPHSPRKLEMCLECKRITYEARSKFREDTN